MALTYVKLSSHRGLAGELASVRSTPCPRPLSGPGVFPGVFGLATAACRLTNGPSSRRAWSGST